MKMVYGKIVYDCSKVQKFNAGFWRPNKFKISYVFEIRFSCV